MTVYSTPEPICACIDLAVGEVRVTATDRGDTVVQVTPTDPTEEADVRAAERTRVEFSNGRLTVAGPKRRGGLPRRTGSVHVALTVPTGSDVDAATSIGHVHGVGELGTCRVRTSAGDIRLQTTAGAQLTTGVGAVEVDQVDGEAQCTTGSGVVRIGRVTAAAHVKNSNGDTWLGDVGGDLRVKAANGDISIAYAHADVELTTANGSINVGFLEHGRAGVKTSLGQIDLGIGAGTAARLDLHTSFGSVRNDLQAADRPGPEDRTVQVHAETSYGDIVIRRARTES